MEKDKKIKFGIKFRGGYKVEVDVDPEQQLDPVCIYVDKDDKWSRYIIWSGEDYGQLYGQMMTLLEAVVSNPAQLEAVKSLLKRELSHFDEVLKAKAILLSEIKPIE